MGGGGGGGGGRNEYTISLRFVSQMFISSYRREIRILYLFSLPSLTIRCVVT